MKKNFLLSMIIMLMTAIGSFAQDQKEYNMVITLNNGTTVTLGHNDIKEITFNDGAVSISGNMVNTIDSLSAVTRDLLHYTEVLNEETRYRLEKDFDTSMSMIYENKDDINNCKNIIQENRNAIEASQQQILELADKNTMLMAKLNNSLNKIEELNQVIAVQDEQMKQLTDYINELRVQIELLNAKIDNKQ